VIARFATDTHFPQPIWGSLQRPIAPELIAGIRARLGSLDTEIARELQG
jgi:hypothetical protein